MDERDLLAHQFEEHRAHLRAVAYRMLGSTSEADDAVQEAWLRLSRSESGEIANLGGWLTTVVARVCLDMLRSRESRREESLDPQALDPPTGDDRAADDHAADPEQQALLADSVGLALHVVLDTLAPAERIAFVLHDVFAVPFDEIAPIVGRAPAAARQLASRARRRVQGASTARDADHTARRAIVDAFFAAARGGDIAALLALLAPDVVMRSDQAAATIGAAAELRGAHDVAKRFSGGARAAQPALVDGSPGAVWIQHRQVRIAFAFTIAGGKIVAIDLIADPERLQRIVSTA